MSKSKKRKVGLRPNPKNPNVMSADDKAKLRQALHEFGDLSGLVINQRSGHLIAGHQRASCLEDGDLRIKWLPQASADGTVGSGVLKHNDQQYNVRIVDWDETKADAAMIAANQFGRLGVMSQDKLLEVLTATMQADISAELMGYDEQEVLDMLQEKVPIKSVQCDRPPELAWLLIGVPIESWADISDAAAKAQAIPNAIVETTVTNGDQNR